MAVQSVTPYEQHREYVLAVLRRRCGWLAPDEREAVLHDAYVVLLEKERDAALDPQAMHSHELRAYLTQTAINKALDEGKRAERKRTEPLGERAFAEPDHGAAPEERAAQRFDDARVREIVDELPARRQAVVKLRFFFDRAPAEIQQLLAITARVYRRELERGLRHIAEQYELVRAGRFCDSRRSLIISYIAGTAEPPEQREAREHLASCPGCVRWAIEMREATHRVAVAVPLPALALIPGAGSRLVEAAVSARDGLMTVASTVKHHATALVTRADPSAAGETIPTMNEHRMATSVPRP